MSATNVVFLSVDHVLAIHDRMLREYGGPEGLRDRGLLESAVAMPFATFDGQFLHDGIPTMAAAYLYHLCRNHPFVDGNKRAALASAVAFLYVNGRQLNASKRSVEALTFGVADGTVSKQSAAEFFRRHSTRERSATTPSVKPKRARRRRDDKKQVD